MISGNVSVLIHPVQDRIGPVGGAIVRGAVPIVHVLPGIIVVWALGEASKEGALPDGQFGEFLSEIVLGCRLYPVVGAAQIYVVEICFQDLVLVHNLLQLDGQIRFLHLALVGALRPQDLVLDQLLGDGAAAGGVAVAQNF